MATLTMRKPDANSTTSSREGFREALLSSDFPPVLLKNVSSELNLDGEAVRSFISKAQEYAGDSKGLDRLRLLTEFVNKHIPYDSNKIGYPILEDVLSGQSGGVCLHKASALQLVLVHEGWNVKSEDGVATYKNIILGSHAWLSVVIDGVKYISDPTNMILGEYQEFDIKQIATGFLQQQIVKHYGSLLHRKTTKVEITYQNFWNMEDGSEYKHVAPEAIEKAVAEVAPIHAKFTKMQEECTKLIANGKTKSKAIEKIESEIIKAYSLWSWKSKVEEKWLSRLNHASNP